jgi:hypothetical protein
MNRFTGVRVCHFREHRGETAITKHSPRNFLFHLRRNIFLEIIITVTEIQSAEICDLSPHTAPEDNSKARFCH